MSDNSRQPPGWYYAAGDPPGTHRYWDGELWQGSPEPVAPARAPGSPPPPPGPAGRYYSMPSYREPSQATTALVLSILGLVVCGILGPFGWSMAQKELDGIDAGRRDPNNRGQAQAAKVIGIIVTVLMLLVLLLVFFVVAAAA